ncbi:serine/threonine protein kinase [Nostoc sp. MBR 210]|nr:serine/threonine protein kinase [Nostoc sp. MBR 210]
MPWIAGQQLQNSKYVIEQVLGQGGFGITYKALQVGLNRPVVIKTPKEDPNHDPEYDKYVEQFIREGQILARLSQDPHPHIVGVIDLFRENSIPCLVMEFVEGENLFDAVTRRGALPEAEILPCICQMAEALMIVHKAGLVHRDAHPKNIMLRRNSKAVLIDFGIAKQVIPSANTSNNKHGHEAFAPYEQIVSGSREPTVDVYCLAATLYYAVTGQRPTTSLARKLNDAPLIAPKQHNRAISERLNQAILKGMALEAKDRPQSMQAWLTILKTPKVPPPPPVEPVNGQEVVRPEIQLKPEPTLGKSVTKSPRIIPLPPVEPVHRQKVVRPEIQWKPEPTLGKSVTKSPKIIPWSWLIVVLFCHPLIGYSLAVSNAPFWAVAVAVAAVMAVVAVAVTLAATLGVTWVMAVGVVAGVVWAGAWAWFLVLTGEKLQKSFSAFHTFLILAGISNLGLGLGWLLGKVFAH